MATSVPGTLNPEDLFTGAVPNNGFFCGLFTNDVSSMGVVSFLDLIEPTFPGYERAGPLVWEDEPSNTPEEAVHYFEQAAFMLASDIDPVTIRGWFLTCQFDDGVVILHVEHYEEPELWAEQGDNTEIFPTSATYLFTNP